MNPKNFVSISLKRGKKDQQIQDSVQWTHPANESLTIVHKNALLYAIPEEIKFSFFPKKSKKFITVLVPSFEQEGT